MNDALFDAKLKEALLLAATMELIGVDGEAVENAALPPPAEENAGRLE